MPDMAARVLKRFIGQISTVRNFFGKLRIDIRIQILEENELPIQLRSIHSANGGAPGGATGAIISKRNAFVFGDSEKTME
jgi:hypothetical protein